MTDVNPDDLVNIEFTQSEIDMLYWSALHDIGHPEALGFELTDSGFDTLLRALTKIQAHMESLYEADLLSGEPEVEVV